MVAIVSSARLCAAFGFALALLAGGCDSGEPATKGGPIEARRLTESQYRQSIADIFGADIEVAGRFEPELRTDGLLAVGTAEVTVSGAGFEQYYGMARNIAAQVVNDKHRAGLIPCRPASADGADTACETMFFEKYGRLILRRPFAGPRLQKMVAVAGQVAAAKGDFYAGLEFALAGLLTEPEFLFRVDVAEPDSAHPGSERLDAYSKADRLSFFLWNAAPDAELLAAAERGDLDSSAGLRRQVDRLLASPRVEAGVRAFFSDFLGFDSFATLEKDGLIYPAFNQKTAADAKEQTLRTIVDHLVARRGDYRDLFTTRHTFMTRVLGRIYAVPVAPPHGWEAFDFPDGDAHAGILTELSFTALHSHPGRSSPTLRGKALRELLLCEKVPAPPANVNFSIVQDTTNPDYKTARARLSAHRAEPTCAGCHKIMDPMGLALENFDGAGQPRSEENGVPIDASGELDGVRFRDAAGLGKAMHDNPNATSCLVNSLYGYAAGRKPDAGESEWMKWLETGFAAGGYELPGLMRRVATSEAFYRISLPESATPAAKTALGIIAPTLEARR